MRKFWCNTLWISLVLPFAAYSLGLSDVVVTSALNQPLRAQIPLVDLEDINLTSVKAKIASVEDFNRLGVTREGIASQLQFTINRNSAGVPVVVITTSAPISDPSLTFVLNLTWPNGQLLREYTIFLDPSNYAPQSQVIAPVMTDRVSTVSNAPSSVKVRRPAPITPNTQNDNTYGPTTDADDLWAIARKTIPGSHISVQQQVVAIFQLNANAFQNENVNGLKSGYLLLLPTAEQAAALTTQEANQFLAEQNKLWKLRNTSAPVPMPVANNLNVQTQNLPEPLNLTPQLPQEAQSMLIKPNTVNSPAAPAENTTAVEGTSTTNQTTNTTVPAPGGTLESQVTQLQKQLMEKDRQILILQKLLEEQQTQAKNPATNNTKLVQTTTALPMPASQAGQIVAHKPLPWYGFIIIFFSMLVSLLAGAYLQRRQIGNQEMEIPEDLLTPETLPKEPLKTDPEAVKWQPSRVAKQEEILSEADSLIQSAQYVQAEALLSKLIQQDKDNTQAKIKILEILAAEHNVSAFNAQYAALNDSQTLLSETENQHVTALYKKLNPDLEQEKVEPVQAEPSDVKSAPSDHIIEFEKTEIVSKPSPANQEASSLSDEVWDDMLTKLSVSQETEPLKTEKTTETDLPDTEKTQSQNWQTQIDLARAYIEMQDYEEAYHLLEDIVKYAQEEQAKIAQKLLEDVKRHL